MLVEIEDENGKEYLKAEEITRIKIEINEEYDSEDYSDVSYQCKFIMKVYMLEVDDDYSINYFFKTKNKAELAIKKINESLEQNNKKFSQVL